MQERENIRVAKEAGLAKPWSADPIFQTTYFCNVNRENDRVTKWIRSHYSSFVSDSMFEVNIGFSRIINHPATLDEIGYIPNPASFKMVGGKLEDLARGGAKVFGDAYIVSTNGRPIPKAQYVVSVLLPALYGTLAGDMAGAKAVWGRSCQAAYGLYMGIFGISSFMAGQNIADLKNTPGHPLYNAPDKWKFCCAGPGSLRGLSWIFNGTDQHPINQTFQEDIQRVHEILVELGVRDSGLTYDMQDLQNCLCEFDKYMRIKTGVGRSKRRYNGVDNNV